jgi:hypothetical protein
LLSRITQVVRTAAGSRRGHLPGLITSATILLFTPAAPAQQVTGDEVRLAVEAAKSYLLGKQSADGTWIPYRFPGGTTAMATLALLNAGLEPDEPRMQRAIEAVRGIPLKHTYVVCLKIQALVAADPSAHRADLQAATNWLAKAQHANGMWGYGQKTRGHTDFSNSQFALLGLHEAANAGIPVPRTVWRKAERAWRQGQRKDGGWGYVPNAPRSTGSMTTAGIASLYITGNSLAMLVGRRPGDPDPPCCGKYATYRPIARGLAWLSQHFSVARNPGAGGWYFYYLYGLERVGILSGLQHIGPHDWYRQAAARLIRMQKQNGSWKEINPIVDTAFALLFLAKGHRPVLFHKLKWSNDARWNVARNDLAHLVAFIGDRLGGKPVGWSTVDLEGDVDDWLAAPILYLSGREFPAFSAQHKAKLREYVDYGGTILAEASCGMEAFRIGFTTFAKDVFDEYELRPLPPEHPVFRALFELDGSQIQLYGLDVGCRTSVFFSPADLSCLWEYGDVPVKSRAAFELGTNIAAYATALETLPDKLDAASLVRSPAGPDMPESPPRGALYIAQLMHNGDWRPFPRAVPNLAHFLHKNMGVDVVGRYEPLEATDPRLSQHPILYMTGSLSFILTPEQVAALRRHLERGGFLFADACCGHRPFDTSFRELAAQLFPELALERLPANHPIITGSPGVPLPEVRYLPAVAAEEPALKHVWLEGITLHERTVIVYSRFGLGGGLGEHACFGCQALLPADARQLAANIILYALSH